jgi:phospholipase C
MKGTSHCRRIIWFCALIIASWADPLPAAAEDGLKKIKNIIILYLENRSFNNLLGTFPGANGIARAKQTVVQRDRSGTSYRFLPPTTGPFDVESNVPEVRALTLPQLPNEPFALDQVVPGISIGTTIRNVTHLFYTNRAQVNGGANDRFAALSNAGGLTMSYYSQSAMAETHLWKSAQRGVLFDNFFQGAFGGSFLNHIWLVCGCAPIWPNPPASQRSILDATGVPVEEKRITTTSDGDYAVNTTQSVFFNDGNQGENLLPGQTAVTIGDRLSEKGVDWAWYSEGWDLAIIQDRTADQQTAMKTMRFAYHHQPFAYFHRFDPSTARGRAQRRTHLRDAKDFENDLQSGQLPPVSIYKPANINSEHPGEGSVAAGDALIGRLVEMIDASPVRDSYAFIITYDEFGGLFDHVPPPTGAQADFFGPGTRIPAVLVSPFVKPGTIDSTELETTSILKFISERFDLDPLPNARFHQVKSLSKAFDFR